MLRSCEIKHNINSNTVHPLPSRSHCIPYAASLQVEDLKWEVEQRQREIETQKQQLEMVEQCHQREMDSVQDTLQVRCCPHHGSCFTLCQGNV